MDPIVTAPVPAAPQATEPNKPATPPAPKTPEEFFELNVKGKQVKLSRDEVIKRAQIYEHSNQNNNEAAEKFKKVEALKANFKKNPMQALMDPELGLTKAEIRTAMETWYNQEFIEPETLTPEQLELRDLREERRKSQEQEKLKKDQDEDDNRKKMTEKEKDYFQGKIVEAMEQSNLPKSKFLAGRVAFYTLQNLESGWDAPVDVIVHQVKEERANIMADITESSTAEQLIEMLGEGVINKIRKYDLEKLRAGRSTPSASPQQSAGAPKPGEKVSMRDVELNLKRMRQGW